MGADLCRTAVTQDQKTSFFPSDTCSLVRALAQSFLKIQMMQIFFKKKKSHLKILQLSFYMSVKGKEEHFKSEYKTSLYALFSEAISIDHISQRTTREALF